jgi:hypothetical protein
MRRSGDRGGRGIGNSPAEELVRALHCGVTRRAPKHERWNFDGRERRRSERETIGTRPIEDIGCGRLDGATANTLWPAGEEQGETCLTSRAPESIDVENDPRS